MYLQLRHGCFLRSMPYFGRARKIGLMIEDGFQNGAGIVERESDAESEQRGQQQDLLHPGARMQFTLRANVEDRHGEGGGQKDRDVDQEHSQPAALRPASGGMEQHA